MTSPLKPAFGGIGGESSLPSSSMITTRYGTAPTAVAATNSSGSNHNHNSSKRESSIAGDAFRRRTSVDTNVSSSASTTATHNTNTTGLLFAHPTNSSFDDFPYPPYSELPFTAMKRRKQQQLSPHKNFVKWAMRAVLASPIVVLVFWSIGAALFTSRQQQPLQQNGFQTSSHSNNRRARFRRLPAQQQQQPYGTAAQANQVNPELYMNGYQQQQQLQPLVYMGAQPQTTNGMNMAYMAPQPPQQLQLQQEPQYLMMQQNQHQQIPGERGISSSQQEVPIQYMTSANAAQVAQIYTDAVQKQGNSHPRIVGPLGSTGTGTGTSYSTNGNNYNAPVLLQPPPPAGSTGTSTTANNNNNNYPLLVQPFPPAGSTTTNGNNNNYDYPVLVQPPPPAGSTGSTTTATSTSNGNNNNGNSNSNYNNYAVQQAQQQPPPPPPPHPQDGVPRLQQEQQHLLMVMTLPPQQQDNLLSLGNAMMASGQGVPPQPMGAATTAGTGDHAKRPNVIHHAAPRGATATSSSQTNAGPTILYYDPQEAMANPQTGQFVLPNVVYDAHGNAMDLQSFKGAQIFMEPPPSRGQQHQQQQGRRQVPMQELSVDVTKLKKWGESTSQDQMIIVSTVAVMALLVGALSARRLRSRSVLSACIENESLEDDVAFDAAYTTTAAAHGTRGFGTSGGGGDHSYNTFGGWKGDLEKFDV